MLKNYPLYPCMNMSKKLLITVLLSFTVNSYSQQQFQKKYESTNGSRAYSIKLTHDGGYIIAGSYDVSGLLSAEYYIIKLDATGDTLWANTYGQKVDTTLTSNRDGAGNEAYDIIQTFDSGYMVVGEAHTFDSLGKSDIFILKLTPTGDTSWGKTYGGLNSDYGYKIIQLSDSGYIVSGYTESYGSGIRDAYVMRLNSIGDTLWAKAYGGNSIDGSNDFIQTVDGGFLLVGNTFSFGAGGSDVYAVKIDPNGTVQWEYAYGGANNDFGNSVVQTQDSGFVISGSAESFGSGQRDVYVLKLDSIGNLMWSKVFGGSGNESGKSILELANQDLIVMGNTRSFGKGAEDYYLLRLNSLGDTVMTRVYGGASIDFGESVKQTPDKGFILAGYTNSFNTWNYDVYIVKTDSLGNSGCHQSVTSTVIGSPTTIRTTTNSTIGTGSSSKDAVIKIGNTKTHPVNACNINSVQELMDENRVHLFPNPVHHFFSIKSEDKLLENNTSVILFDVNGKALQSFFLTDSHQQIDISAYTKGIYFVRIETKLGPVTKKIVKH